jgi:D-serine dehydratase
MQENYPPPAGLPLNHLDKGAPGERETTPLNEVAERGWNLLQEDFPLPVAVLRDTALRNNSRWMRNYIASSGANIAPHGKTTLAPELFEMQMADGAWGITVSTPHQIRVARQFGHKRIFVANQLVGRKAIEYAFRELDANADLEIYCLSDSLEHVEQLDRVARRISPQRALSVLVEVGFQGGRTGCRTNEEAIRVAESIAASKHLALCGVEGFEGIIGATTLEERLARVVAFLQRIVAVAEACSANDLFAVDQIILSAGGSAFFDLVVDTFQSARLHRPPFLLVRSGCYLIHDSLMYKRAFALLGKRAPNLVAQLGEMEPALEVWAYVQSRPELQRVIVGLGKRDISHDDLPVPLKSYRPGSGETSPLPIPRDHEVVRLDDQHCYMNVPAHSTLRVGDMVALGISHPCLTFDKWRVLHRVDDNYTVIGSLRTYF